MSLRRSSSAAGHSSVSNSIRPGDRVQPRRDGAGAVLEQEAVALAGRAVAEPAERGLELAGGRRARPRRRRSARRARGRPRPRAGSTRSAAPRPARRCRRRRAPRRRACGCRRAGRRPRRPPSARPRRAGRRPSARRPRRAARAAPAAARRGRPAARPGSSPGGPAAAGRRTTACSRERSTTLSPFERGDRDELDLVQADRGAQLEHLAHDLVEALLGEADQVHLVDGHDHVADPQQRGDRRRAGATARSGPRGRRPAAARGRRSTRP